MWGGAKGLTGEARTEGAALCCLWESASPEKEEANLFHFEEKLRRLGEM